MALTYEIKLTAVYEDYTSRTYTFGTTNVEALGTVKTRAKALNANVPNYVKETFISDDGEPFARISAASITAKEETIVYGHGYDG